MDGFITAASIIVATVVAALSLRRFDPTKPRFLMHLFWWVFGLGVPKSKRRYTERETLLVNWTMTFILTWLVLGAVASLSGTP